MAMKNKTAPARGGKTPNVPATTAKTSPQSTGKEVAAIDEDLKSMMEQDAGRGVSTKASDNVVPLIYLLQAQSPQCLRQHANYVSPGVNGEKGAIAGNLWFRGTKDLVDGEGAGMLAQLCHFRVVWNEWGPERGDGLKARHDERPEDAELVVDPKNDKKKKWVMPDTGNVVVETREHAVLIHGVYDSPSPFIIAMSGSNHQPAKQWMTDIGRKRIPDTDKRASLWAFMWRIKTIPRTDGENNWFSYTIEDEEQMVDIGAYRLGRQLHDDFEKGLKKADVAEDDMANRPAGEQDDSDI